MHFNHIEEVCTYSFAEQRSTADELRFKLITRNIGFNLNVPKVICISDALSFHCLRAAAQTYLWRNSSQPKYERLNFLQLGYEIRDGKQHPVQMAKPPLPNSSIGPCMNIMLIAEQGSCKKAILLVSL
ncbi:hypothetical protein JTB14_000399 [Gonioctena quinquepunctata]|nr:hypothetical protein JTB14_000399 [Gonioctena quinquepunctata]